MQTKPLGIILIIIGIIMIAYTGFNFITTKNVVDMGPIQIDKQVNHPVQWSPIVGVVLLVAGIGIIVVAKKK
jgi:hypothetical protein